MGVWLLEIARILRITVLLAHAGQLSLQSFDMGQVHDNQPLGHLRISGSKTPGDASSPVMTDDHGAAFAFCPDDRGDISSQQCHIIICFPPRLVAQVVASGIQSGHSILICQSGHLMAPGIPEVRKSVDEYHQRATTHLGVVNRDSVAVGILMFNLIHHILSANRTGEQQGRYQQERQDRYASA